MGKWDEAGDRSVICVSVRGKSWFEEMTLRRIMTLVIFHVFFVWLSVVF